MKEKTAKAFFKKEGTKKLNEESCWSYCWGNCSGMFGMQIWCLTGCLARCHNKGVGNNTGQDIEKKNRKNEKIKIKKNNQRMQ